jgi:hypothetical protein
MKDNNEGPAASRSNTWERVREIRENLISSKTVLSEMEDDWQLITQSAAMNLKLDEPLDPKDPLGMRDDEKTSSTPLNAFRYFLDIGLFPPPEILLAIAECFERYFQAEGQLELEEVFFARPRKKRIGNNSAQEARYRLYKAFCFSHSLEHLEKSHQLKKTGDDTVAESHQVALEPTAEKFLRERGLLDLEVDSFLRGFYRWRQEFKSDK